MAIHVEVRLVGLALGFQKRAGEPGESGGDDVRAGFHWDFDVEVGIDAAMILAGRGRLNGEAFDARAVDEEFDIVGAGDAFDVLIAIAGEADLDFVFGVDGESVAERFTATGA